MNDQEHQDQLDQPTSDQLDAGHQDQLDQGAGDQLDQPADQLAGRSDGGDNGPQSLDPADADAIAADVAGEDQTTTGDQETAPAFPDAPVTDDQDDDVQATEPNPYGSPGFGVTEKFPAIQDDGFDTGAGDQVEDDDDTEDQE